VTYYLVGFVRKELWKAPWQKSPPRTMRATSSGILRDVVSLVIRGDREVDDSVSQTVPGSVVLPSNDRHSLAGSPSIWFHNGKRLVQVVADCKRPQSKITSVMLRGRREGANLFSVVLSDSRPSNSCRPDQQSYGWAGIRENLHIPS
jgi:hypothetical protein